MMLDPMIFATSNSGVFATRFTVSLSVSDGAVQIRADLC